MINPMIGIKIDDIDMKTVRVSSINEKKGFSKPPENVVNNALNETVETWKKLVTPTPHIIDKSHCKPGSKLFKLEKERIVPAIIEAGVATISSILSMRGTKVAKSSIILATVNKTIIQSFPIQLQVSPNSTKLAL